MTSLLMDGNYGSAYLLPNQQWLNSFGPLNNNNLTVAANPRHGWKLRKLLVSFSVVPTNPQLVVKGNGVTLQVIDLPAKAGYQDLSPALDNIASSPGNQLQITLQSLQEGQSSSSGSSNTSAQSGGPQNSNINAYVEPI
jgi:hypothetical protein